MYRARRPSNADGAFESWRGIISNHTGSDTALVGIAMTSVRPKTPLVEHLVNPDASDEAQMATTDEREFHVSVPILAHHFPMF